MRRLKPLLVTLLAGLSLCLSWMLWIYHAIAHALGLPCF